MDAVEFLKERSRMCFYYREVCSSCPLKGCNRLSFGCGNSMENMKEAVSVVEDWSKNNPPKTILQDFVEKFPNAPVDSDGLPKLCPYQCGYEEEKCDCRSRNDVSNCFSCWNRTLGVSNK